MKREQLSKGMCAADTTLNIRIVTRDFGLHENISKDDKVEFRTGDSVFHLYVEEILDLANAINTKMESDSLSGMANELMKEYT